MRTYKLSEAAEMIGVLPGTIRYRAMRLGLEIINGRISEDTLQEVKEFWERGSRGHQPQSIKDFIAEVEEERENQKIGIKAFARSVGIGYSFYYFIVKGQRTPSHHTLSEMADALGMKVVYALVEREE